LSVLLARRRRADFARHEGALAEHRRGRLKASTVSSIGWSPLIAAVDLSRQMLAIRWQANQPAWSRV
jgi:hypothetical protein